MTLFPFTLLPLPSSFWEEEYSQSQLSLWEGGPSFISAIKSFQALFSRWALRQTHQQRAQYTHMAEQATNWKRRHIPTVGTHPIHAVTLRVTSLTAEVCQEIHWIPHVPIQTMKKSHKIPENLMILQCWKQFNLFWECWLFVGTIKS